MRPRRAVDGLVPIHEFLKYLEGRLAHGLQYPGRHVLRGHLQLARHVVAHQFAEKGAVLIRQQIIVADAGANEHLFDPLYLPQPAQHLQVILMAGVQMGAGLGEQALPPLAGAPL